MMKKPWFRTFFASMFMIFASFMYIGSSDFIYGTGEASTDLSIEDGEKAVCYNDSTKYYYTTIEKALAEASNDTNNNDTIYVIPGTNPTIKSDCLIAAGDTLCLPYDLDNSDGDGLWDYREGKTTLRNRFADDCSEMVEANRKSLVTIKKGVTLTVYGNLQIGGVLGNASSGFQGLQGQTSGKYAEILMEAGDRTTYGARIDVEKGGSIDCRGYIKETEISDNPTIQPQLYLYSNSALQLPFVIYDFQGANATGGIYCGNYTINLGNIISSGPLDCTGQVCPFSLFDFPNIQISTYIYSNVMVTGLVSLHTSETKVVITFKESWNLDDFTAIGSSNSLLTINSGYIRIKYKPSNLGYTEVLYYDENPTKTTVDIYGSCSFGAMQMLLNAQIAQVNIDTSDVLFPFSYRWAFNIKNGGTFETTNGIKFMNGCNVTIEKGGTFKINTLENKSGRVMIYSQTWTDSKTTIPYLPTYVVYGTKTIITLNTLTKDTTLGVLTTAPTITGVANFINNGTVEINSGAAIGGNVLTTSTTGKIEFKGGAIKSLETIETNGTGARDNLSYVFRPIDTKPINETGMMNALNNFSSFISTQLEVGTFESTEINNSFGFGTRSGSAVINGDPTILPGAAKEYSISDNGSFLLGDSFVWSCSDTTKATLSSTTGKTIKLSGVTPGDITLSCEVSYQGAVLRTATKTITIEQEPYVNVSVSVIKENIYDVPDNPYSIGGIKDYRDLLVTIDTNCSNYSLNWEYDSSLLELTSSSGSYPTFNYRFTANKAADSTTLKLKFTSAELNPTEPIWTQNISISSNTRITYLTLDQTTFEVSTGSNTKEKTGSFTATISSDGDIDINQLEVVYEQGQENSKALITSISVSDGVLTLNYKASRDFVGSIFGNIKGDKDTHTSKFYIRSSNGKNGGPVDSNLITFNNKKA